MSIVPQRHAHAPQPGSVLPSHYKYCFGCGPDHPSGLHLKVVVGEGLDVTGLFLVTADHQGATGLVHGGLLAAAFDETLGALNWLVLAPAVTGRLEVDFRKPVPVGSEITIRAKVDSVDGRKVWCSGVGTFADGTVAAESRGLFIQVPLEHFQQHRAGEEPTPGGLEINP